VIKKKNLKQEQNSVRKSFLTNEACPKLWGVNSTFQIPCLLICLWTHCNYNQLNSPSMLFADAWTKICLRHTHKKGNIWGYKPRLTPHRCDWQIQLLCLRLTRRRISVSHSLLPNNAKTHYHGHGPSVTMQSKRPLFSQLP